MRVKVMKGQCGLKELVRAIEPTRPLLPPEQTKTFVVAELTQEQIDQLRGQDFEVSADQQFDLEVG